MVEVRFEGLSGSLFEGAWNSTGEHGGIDVFARSDDDCRAATQPLRLCKSSSEGHSTSRFEHDAKLFECGVHSS